MRASQSRRARSIARVAACLAVVLVVGAASAHAARAATGTSDFNYAGVNQPSAPTGEKPQSKLWFNDGAWWGSIWSNAHKSFDIQRFDATSGWIDTGVAIDSRDKSLADMLWDGTHLYAISAIRQGGATSDPSVRLYRFSYHAGSQTYSLDAEFPITLYTPASSNDLEVATLDEDSTGELWATFTAANAPGLCVSPSACPAGRSVLYTHSTTSDLAWSAPAVLPVPNASDVSGDDISTVVHFGSSTGVLFSDQNPDANGATADYFAVHVDGASDTSWSEETPLSGPLMADDHLNIKAAPDGRVYAAVKTSRNDATVLNPDDPLILLLERTTDGVWHRVVFDTVASEDTRSQVLLDPSQGVLYQFATYPPDGDYEAGGWIYCKAASMDAPVFAAGRGTPFIQLDPSGDRLNNFSSTKQTVSPATDVLGIASDDNAKIYAHNTLDLSGPVGCGGLPPAGTPPGNPDPTPPPTPTPTPAPTPPVTTPVGPVVGAPSSLSGAGSPPATTPPTTTTAGGSSTACSVTSSRVQSRSLASLERTAVVHVRVRATCKLRLTLHATLPASPGTLVASAAVFMKRGQNRIVSVHLTPAGRRLLATHRTVRLVLTTRTPAVKGVTPSRTWVTAINLSA